MSLSFLYASNGCPGVISNPTGQKQWFQEWQMKPVFSDSRPSFSLINASSGVVVVVAPFPENLSMISASPFTLKIMHSLMNHFIRAQFPLNPPKSTSLKLSPSLAIPNSSIPFSALKGSRSPVPILEYRQFHTLTTELMPQDLGYWGLDMHIHLLVSKTFLSLRSLRVMSMRVGISSSQFLVGLVCEGLNCLLVFLLKIVEKSVISPSSSSLAVGQSICSILFESNKVIKDLYRLDISKGRYNRVKYSIPLIQGIDRAARVISSATSNSVICPSISSLIMSEYVRANVRQELFKRQPNTIKYRTHFGVCILEALKLRGYTRVQDDTWDIFWSEKELIDSVFEHARMQNHMRVNHFKKYQELCKKDNLNRNLKKHRKALEREGKLNEAKEYHFFPLTFHLPLEYALFVDEFKMQAAKDSTNIWIMKPTARCQGKGIFLFNKLNSISNWAENQQAEPYIVQRYISNPLLIGGKKFDLRLYVLCTSYQPLTVYLYRSGFARFTHYRYDESKINNTEVHLTNVAIQKTTEDYNDTLGGKWLVDKLKLYMLSKFDSETVNECFYQIANLILKTLRSVIKLMPVDKHCFQLYGFDVMLDNDLKPWIIEVNGSPSMRANTPTDFTLKCGLIDDCLSIVDLQGIMTGNQEQVGGFDVICKDNVDKINRGNVKLGCQNNRATNMKRLAVVINTRALLEDQEKAKKEQDKQRVRSNYNTAKRPQQPISNQTTRPIKNASISRATVQTESVKTTEVGYSGTNLVGNKTRGKSYMIRQPGQGVSGSAKEQMHTTKRL